MRTGRSSEPRDHDGDPIDAPAPGKRPRAAQVAPVQRRAAPSTAEAPAAPAPAATDDPCWFAARARVEPQFGEDFSGVRVHRDSAAAAARGAHAFTEGEDVHFAPGRFAPDTADGAFLVGHELAHVVQQRHGAATVQAKAGASDAPLEREADRAGAAIARGDQVAPITGRAATGVQCFSGEEHKRMGDAATGGEEIEEFSRKDFSLSFGDLVLLAGDMFDSPHQIAKLAETEAGQAELRWAIWYSRDDATKGDPPDVPQATKDRVLARYYQLAAKNVDHFSAGGTAEETYLGHHQHAALLAYQAEVDQDIGLLNEAITREAFAQHHLSDMFSGGHVRTPRAEILAAEAAEREQPQGPSTERIVRYLAARLHHHLSELGDLPWYLEIPSGGLVASFVIDSIVDEIKGKAGALIDEASLATVLSKAQHDADNKGVNVVSRRDEHGARGEETWTAKGDGYVVDGAQIVDDKTFDMAVAAMKVSRAELDLAAALGVEHRDDGTDLFYGRGDAVTVVADTIGLGRAQDFIPREGAGNPELEWTQDIDGDWEPAMAAAIDDTFNITIIPMIRTLIDEKEVKHVEDPVEMTLHIGKAMTRVATEIEASPPHQWLRRALEEYVPDDSPAPPPARTGHEPEHHDGPIVDAGVPAE